MTQYIVSHPDLMMGKPVVAGTRITVEALLQCLAAGESVEEIVQARPRLSLDSVRAAEALRHEVGRGTS